MDKISVFQSLAQDEFVNYSLIRYFKRPWIITLYSLFIICSLFLFASDFAGASQGFSNIYPFLAILLILPIAVFFSARKIYQSNYAMQAVVQYQFSDEQIQASSEKFSYTQSWDLVYRAEESKHWFLIFNNRVNAIYLKKESFQDPADLEILKAILRSKSHIKLNLKK